jgi:hypothetical protein
MSNHSAQQIAIQTTIWWWRRLAVTKEISCGFQTKRLKLKKSGLQLWKDLKLIVLEKGLEKI